LLVGKYALLERPEQLGALEGGAPGSGAECGRVAAVRGDQLLDRLVSPILANLFMRYALDLWMARNFPGCPFERTDLSLDDLARWLNPIVGGWINYYGRYYRTALNPLLQGINAYLRRWAGRKYRRLRTHGRFHKWWTGLLARQPRLFVHWRTVRTHYG
jgi:Group II intron, maturase-specific domain